MLTLQTILSIIGLIAVCWIIAKYNKNDNLFWILLVSIFAGMAGRALVTKFNGTNKNEIRTDFGQVYNPTQVSPADCVDFCTLLGDTSASKAEPAVKVSEIPVRDTKVSFIALSKTFGEIRGQPTQATMFDTS